MPVSALHVRTASGAVRFTGAQIVSFRLRRQAFVSRICRALSILRQVCRFRANRLPMPKLHIPAGVPVPVALTLRAGCGIVIGRKPTMGVSHDILQEQRGSRSGSHPEDGRADAKAGKVDRREFLALASVFGASTAMAYGMLGLAAPTPALAQEPKKGGVLKVAMSIKDPKDPRTADWSEIANAQRQTLEPLVKYTARLHLRALSARKLGSQRRRDRIRAACPPGRRPGPMATRSTPTT